jgi:hypothetical protein
VCPATPFGKAVRQETSESRDPRQNQSPGKKKEKTGKKKEKTKECGCKYIGSSASGARGKITLSSHGRGLGHVAVCPAIPVGKALREEKAESGPCRSTDSAMFYASVDCEETSEQETA